MIPHTRTILRPPTPHQHNTVLLDVVTLAGDVRRDLRPARQLHTRDLALARVGLLGPHHAHTETDALHGRGVGGGERRGCGVAGASAGLAAAAEDLVQRRGDGGRR